MRGLSSRRVYFERGWPWPRATAPRALGGAWKSGGFVACPPAMLLRTLFPRVRRQPWRVSSPSTPPHGPGHAAACPLPTCPGGTPEEPLAPRPTGPWPRADVMSVRAHASQGPETAGIAACHESRMPEDGAGVCVAGGRHGCSHIPVRTAAVYPGPHGSRVPRASQRPSGGGGAGMRVTGLGRGMPWTQGLGWSGGDANAGGNADCNICLVSRQPGCTIGTCHGEAG